MSARPLALIVEDSDDQTTLLRRYFDREGYDTVAFADTESAVAVFDRIDPAVAIVDLLLPGLPGEECARLLRERFPGCRLLISSVLDPVEYPVSDCALPKPVTGAQLHDALGRLCS